MLTNPRFDEDDLAKEQKVIIEEMKMIEDTPDELLTELFHAKVLSGSFIGALSKDRTDCLVIRSGHDLEISRGEFCAA